MTKGLALPIEVDVHGRTKTFSGSEELTKIIMINLCDLENGNPFTQWGGASKGEPGIDPGIIFSVDIDELEVRIKRNIKLLFERLETQERAKLVSGYPIMTFDEELGELIAKIQYTDLETDKVVEFEHKYQVVER